MSKTVQLKINGENVYPQTIFSEEEIVIGKWIDGKPVYKSIVEGTINSSGSYQIIYNKHIKHLIDYCGYIDHQNDNYDVVIGKSTYRNSSGEFSNISRIIRLNESLRLDYQNTEYNCPFCAVIIYTKTTD